jgi:hypothetical protein
VPRGCGRKARVCSPNSPSLERNPRAGKARLRQLSGPLAAEVSPRSKPNRVLAPVIAWGCRHGKTTRCTAPIRKYQQLPEVTPNGSNRTLCGRIWTPPDCNSRLDWDRWSQLLTYIRLRDAAGQRLRREPRWVFARFHLKAPMTLERHAGPHIRFGKRRSDRFAISCHLLQLPGRDLLSLFAASVHAAFTDSAGS